MFSYIRTSITLALLFTGAYYSMVVVIPWVDNAFSFLSYALGFLVIILYLGSDKATYLKALSDFKPAVTLFSMFVYFLVCVACASAGRYTLATNWFIILLYTYGVHVNLQNIKKEVEEAKKQTENK